MQFAFSSAHFCFLYPLLRVDPGGTPIYFLCVNFCFIFPENPILDKKENEKKEDVKSRNRGGKGMDFLKIWVPLWNSNEVYFGPETPDVSALISVR